MPMVQRRAQLQVQPRRRTAEKNDTSALLGSEGGRERECWVCGRWARRHRAAARSQRVGTWADTRGMNKQRQ